MKVDVEYAVLGSGVVGSAAAYLLARSKKSTALIEQFQPGHNRGSSHGESRITRLSYDHPLYIRMARRTFELWNEIESECDKRLYLKTGGIDIGVKGDTRIEACRASMDAENVPYDLLDRQEIINRFPQFNLQGDSYGLVQTETGILSATLCVESLAALAEKHGAQLLKDTAVNRVTISGDKVILQSEGVEVRASYLIICAGSWSGPLLARLGLDLPLTVTQEQWAFFSPIEPELFEPGRFPVFIAYNGVGSGGIGWYGFPIFGQPGVKTSIHASGNPTTAATRSFEPDSILLSRLKELVGELLPDAAGEIISTSTCLYTNTPDKHFVVDLLPGASNVALFTGCSGHAFKFGPVLAEQLISLVSGGGLPTGWELFNCRRFASIGVS